MTHVSKPVGHSGIQQELRAIKAEAQQLGSFTGQDDYPDNQGFNDDDESFVAQGAKYLNKPNTFKFKLSNKGGSSVDRDLVIHPGLFTSEAALTAYGITCDGILKTGGVIPGAAAAAQVTLTNMRPATVEMLQEFLRHNPSRLIGMTISATDPSQFETEMMITRANPFRKEAFDEIDISSYYSPDQFSSKKVEVDLVNVAEDTTLGNQAVMSMKLLAGQDVIITLRFGGTSNEEKKFDQRAKSARTNAAQKLAAKGSQRRPRI